jgi:hypothetical protein
MSKDVNVRIFVATIESILLDGCERRILSEFYSIPDEVPEWYIYQYATYGHKHPLE